MEAYIPFLIFVIVMTSTPGPGNLTMMAIGQTTGFRSSVPLLIGSTIGFNIICWLVALGLAKTFISQPLLFEAMKYVGAAYICYLGWKVLRIKIVQNQKPLWFTFTDGFLIHPLSPKSWAMCIVGFSQFCNPTLPVWRQALVFVATFFVCQVSFHSLWCVLGAFLLRLLKKEIVGKSITIGLVVLMITATIYAMFLS